MSSFRYRHDSFQRPNNAFAAHHEAEYTPVGKLGDQQVSVLDENKVGTLLCHASRQLGNPYPYVSYVLVVVH